VSAPRKSAFEDLSSGRVTEHGIPIVEFGNQLRRQPGAGSAAVSALGRALRLT